MKKKQVQPKKIEVNEKMSTPSVVYSDNLDPMLDVYLCVCMCMCAHKIRIRITPIYLNPPPVKVITN